jgi:hypothetical protein
MGIDWGIVQASKGFDHSQVSTEGRGGEVSCVAVGAIVEVIRVVGSSVVGASLQGQLMHVRSCQ